MTLNIDQEYQALIPPLTAEEFAQLEANILRDGCLHPIVTWEETIIDGHNRYAICKKHDLPFKIITMEFDDRDAAMDWMDTNQLGRRNLSPVDFKLALGRRYNRTKKSVGKPEGTILGQIDPISTAAKLATQHGVSEATVKRAGKLAEAVEAHPEIKEAIASGKSIKEAMKEHEEPETTVVNAVKNKKQPQKTLEEQVKEEQNISLGKLKSAWIGATTITRKEFLLWVEKTKNSTHA
jgi:ParB-like chromosome segregation protein Spo0J